MYIVLSILSHLVLNECCKRLFDFSPRVVTVNHSHFTTTIISYVQYLLPTIRSRFLELDNWVTGNKRDCIHGRHSGRQRILVVVFAIFRYKGLWGRHLRGVWASKHTILACPFYPILVFDIGGFKETLRSPEVLTSSTQGQISISVPLQHRSKYGSSKKKIYLGSCSPSTCECIVVPKHDLCSVFSQLNSIPAGCKPEITWHVRYQSMTCIPPNK